MWVAYWVFAVAGNIAIAIIPFGLASMLQSRPGFHPFYLFALIVGIWLGIVAVSVWQWVGVWRSAGKRIRQRALQRRRAPWAWAARFLTIVAFLQLAGALLTSGGPQIAEISRIAFLDDPDENDNEETGDADPAKEDLFRMCMKQIDDYLHETKGCDEMQWIDSRALARHTPESLVQEGNRVD